MKIEKTGGVGLSRGVVDKKSAKKTSNQGGEGFVSNVSPGGAGGDDVDGIDRAAGYVEATSGVASLEALIAVQEVSFQDDGHKNDIEWGKDMLDHLGDLRRSILEGSVSKDDLERILERLNPDNRRYVDKKLDGILDEIELRASVELAKRGFGKS